MFKIVKKPYDESVLSKTQFHDCYRTIKEGREVVDLFQYERGKFDIRVLVQHGLDPGGLIKTTFWA